MLQQLRSFQADRIDVEEGIALLMFAEGLAASYDRHGLETPEWITNAIVTLKSEIKQRTHDELVRQKKLTEAEIEGLLTAGEKRERAKAKLARINAKLGQ